MVNTKINTQTVTSRGNYPLRGISSETVSLLRPLALLAANTLLPLAVSILERKPCLFFLLRFDG